MYIKHAFLINIQKAVELSGCGDRANCRDEVVDSRAGAQEAEI